VGYVIGALLLLIPGTKVANNFGEPDTAPSSIKKVLFGKLPGNI
jgi:hypothetical protein